MSYRFDDYQECLNGILKDAYQQGKGDMLGDIIDSLNIMHGMVGVDNNTLDLLIKSLNTKKQQEEDPMKYEQAKLDMFYQYGRNDAIDDFVSEMRKYYFDTELQSAKDDPCVIDAMIDLSIRTAKQIKEKKNA